MIPKLRFPEFTDNWTVTELGECSDIQTGKALPSSDILEFGDRLICRGINVKSGFLESNSEINRFTNSFIDRKYLVQNDDILLPMDGSKVGKNIAVADLEFHNSFLIQRVARIRLPKELVWFYFQQLWSWNFERYVFTINTSSGIPHISEKQIRRFKVSKPSLEEAHKISSLFELVNKKINLLTNKKEVLETHKKGLNQKIFSQELRFKREDGTDYPEWTKVKLSDVCQIFGRIGFRGYTVKDIVDKGEGAITISPSDITNNKINFDDCTYISMAKYEESPEIKIFNGDILLVKTASIGKSAIVKNLEERATINPQFVVLKEINLDNDFLYYQLNYSDFKRQIQKIAAGGVLKTISQEHLKALSVLKPSKEEQFEIVKALSSADKHIEKIELQIKLRKKQKRGLLQQMFV